MNRFGANPFTRKFRYGGGKRRVPGEMNRGERRYYEYLSMLLRAGEIQWFAFESITLKLADDTRFTPDFMVLANDGILELLDVKGATNKKIGGIATGEKTFFCEEDAKLKIKFAAEHFPFRCAIVWPVGVGWGRKDF